MPRNYKVGDHVRVRELTEYANPGPYTTWISVVGNDIAVRHRRDYRLHVRELGSVAGKEFVIKKLTYCSNSNFYTVTDPEGRIIHIPFSDIMLEPATGMGSVPILF